MPNAFALAAQYAPEGMQVSRHVLWNAVTRQRSLASYVPLSVNLLPLPCTIFSIATKVEQNRTFVIETARGKADLRSRLVEVFNSADTRGVPNGLLDYKEV